mmetsp:Transcript_43165/g.90365  ORF Transcript_43165/g.90365 Transcript_43165/m.90365 type:complete len:339 (+) Transcript_43165:900-1916(+)
MAILCHGSLTLENLDQHSRLVVLSSGESLGLLRWDHSVAPNQLGQNTTNSLDTKSERSDVEQKKVSSLLASFSRENTTLNSSTIRHSLIRVDALVRLLAVEVVLKELLNLGNTGRAADQDKLVNLILLQRRILENLLNRAKGLLEEIHAKLLELRTSNGLRQVRSIEERLDLNALLMSVRQSTLGTLNLTAKLLHSLLVFGGVLVRLLLEQFKDIIDNTTIEILSTQMSVTVGGDNLKNTVVDSEKRHIESATTKIENQDVFLATLVVQTVRNRSGSGFVNNTENVETGDSACILGSLTLGIIEISRHCNNGILDLASEEGLGNLLHLVQNHGRNLFR